MRRLIAWTARDVVGIDAAIASTAIASSHVASVQRLLLRPVETIEAAAGAEAP